MDNLLASALALTVAAPMSYIVQISLNIHFSGWHAMLFFLFAAATLLLLELIGWNRVTAIAIPSAAVVFCLCAWYALGEAQREPLAGFYWWTVDKIYGSTDCPPGYCMLLTAIETFLTTLIIWLFGRKFFCFPAVFAFVVGVVLVKWMSGMDTVLAPGMWACAGLILLWAKSFQRKAAKRVGKKMPENGIPLFLLPAAALIVLLGLGSVSADTAREWQSRRVYDLFERVNNYLADYTHFDRPRNAFSIAAYGFMPMGNRLGGPTVLSDTDVMQVSAPGRMLLRGTIYNEYTGTAWNDTTDNRKIRFGGAVDGTRKDAFDLERPALSGDAQEDFERYVQPVTIRVNPVIHSPSTLFVPYRGVSVVTSDRFLAVVPCFSPNGEVFSSSDVHAGYAYRVKADYLAYNAGGFDALMDGLLAMGLRDTPEHEEYIRQNYLLLPDTIESSVYGITNAVTQGIDVELQPSASSIDSNTLFSAYNFNGDIHTGVSASTSRLYEHLKLINLSPEMNDYEKALTICDFLKKSCKYTLAPETPPEDADFVSYFLTREPEGYCTYFASAMAVMARIAGIPSRYVEGYMLPEKSAKGSVYEVKGRNAHAWAELYFEGIGWIPFDATPPGEAADTGAGGGYIPIEPMPTPPHPSTGNIDFFPEGNGGGLTWEDIAAHLWMLPAAAAALAALWVLAMMLRAKARVMPGSVRRRYYGDRSRQCAFYYFELLRLLEYYNYPLKTGETPYAYAARIDRWLRLEAGAFSEIANLIALISYSDYEPTEEDVKLFARFRRELAEYTYRTVGPWYYLWRHVLGFRRKATDRPPPGR